MRDLLGQSAPAAQPLCRGSCRPRARRPSVPGARRPSRLLRVHLGGANFAYARTARTTPASAVRVLMISTADVAELVREIPYPWEHRLRTHCRPTSRVKSPPPDSPRRCFCRPQSGHSPVLQIAFSFFNGADGRLDPDARVCVRPRRCDRRRVLSRAHPDPPGDDLRPVRAPSSGIATARARAHAGLLHPGDRDGRHGGGAPARRPPSARGSPAPRLQRRPRG